MSHTETQHSLASDTAARDMQQPTQPSTFTEFSVHSAQLGLHNSQSLQDLRPTADTLTQPDDMTSLPLRPIQPIGRMLTRSQTRAVTPAYLDIEVRQPVHVQPPYTDSPWSETLQAATVPTAYTTPLATDSTVRQPHLPTQSYLSIQPTLSVIDNTYTTQPAAVTHTQEPPAMHAYRQQPYTQTPTGTHNLELLAVAAASGRADTSRTRMQSRISQGIARPPTLTPVRRRTSDNTNMSSGEDSHFTSVSQQRHRDPPPSYTSTRHTRSSRHSRASAAIQPLDINALFQQQQQFIANVMADRAAHNDNVIARHADQLERLQAALAQQHANQQATLLAQSEKQHSKLYEQQQQLLQQSKDQQAAAIAQAEKQQSKLYEQQQELLKQNKEQQATALAQAERQQQQHHEQQQQLIKQTDAQHETLITRTTDLLRDQQSTLLQQIDRQQQMHDTQQQKLIDVHSEQGRTHTEQLSALTNTVQTFTENLLQQHTAQIKDLFTLCVKDKSSQLTDQLPASSVSHTVHDTSHELINLHASVRSSSDSARPMSRPDHYVSQPVEAPRLFQNTSSAVYGEPATQNHVTFGDALFASSPSVDANLPPLGPSNTLSHMASPPMLAAPVHHAACTIPVHQSLGKTITSAAPQYLADLGAPATVTYDIPAQTRITTVTATPLLISVPFVGSAPLYTSAQAPQSTSVMGGASPQLTAYTCSAPVLTGTPTLPTLVALTAAATVPPTASVPSTTPAVPTPAPPTVVVKQPLSVKPYCGQSGWKSFKEHFMRICKINEWHDAVTRVNHLTIALEGPAAEILRDIDENAPDAWDRIWEALRRRFGHIDDQRETMYRFDSCKQTDEMSIQEFETKLRTLYAEAWPHASPQQRESDLKRRFEDGLQQAEMRQFLRLHAQTDSFEATVAKARQFYNAQEATRPKKAIRIVTDTSHDDSANLTTESAIVKGMETIAKTLGDRLDKILTLQTSDGRRNPTDDRDRPNKQSKRDKRNGQQSRPPNQSQKHNQLNTSGRPQFQRWDKGYSSPSSQSRSPSPAPRYDRYRPPSPVPPRGRDDNRYQYQSPPQGKSQDHHVSHLRRMMAADSTRDLNIPNLSTQDRSTGLPHQQNLRVRIVDHQSDL